MTPHIGQRIAAQFDALSAQEQRVASFILDHFDDLAVYSAADLARLTGVSKSTVSRLFKRLGFESYRTVKTHARQLRNLGVPLVIDARAMEEESESGAPFQRHLQRECVGTPAGEGVHISAPAVGDWIKLSKHKISLLAAYNGLVRPGRRAPKAVPYDLS